jgi:hypothetical protein
MPKIVLKRPQYYRYRGRTFARGRPVDVNTADRNYLVKTGHFKDYKEPVAGAGPRQRVFREMLADGSFGPPMVVTDEAQPGEMNAGDGLLLDTGAMTNADLRGPNADSVLDNEDDDDAVDPQAAQLDADEQRQQDLAAEAAVKAEKLPLPADGTGGRTIRIGSTRRTGDNRADAASADMLLAKAGQVQARQAAASASEQSQPTATAKGS